MSSFLHNNFLKYQAKIFPSTPKKAVCLLVKCTGLHQGFGTLEGRVETLQVFKGKRIAGAKGDRWETCSGSGVLPEDERIITKCKEWKKCDPENIYRWTSL